MKSGAPLRPLLAVVSLAAALSFSARAAAQEDTTDEAGDAKDGASATSSDESPTPSDDEGTPKKDQSDDKKESDEEGAMAKAEASTSVELTAPSRAPYRRLWFGVSGSLDVALTGRTNDACKLDFKLRPVSAGDYCTNPDGSDFPNRVLPQQNDALVPGKAGVLDGGFKLADVRVTFAADYALTQSILVGARIGYVANTYTGDAALKGRAEFLRHFHAEARGTYVFGRDALWQVGFAPMAFLGVGFGTTDAHASTQASLTGVRGTTPVTAWQVAGPLLASIGGGTRYTFSTRAAFTAAWKLSLAFGIDSPLFTTGPELTFQYGF
jgi:hypothetical protein